jgi:hypothetical protein
MRKLWHDPLHRHVAFFVVLKFVLLALLWWFAVREYRSEFGSDEVGRALLPGVPFVAETHKDPSP